MVGNQLAKMQVETEQNEGLLFRETRKKLTWLKPWARLVSITGDDQAQRTRQAGSPRSDRDWWRNGGPFSRDLSRPRRARPARHRFRAFNGQVGTGGAELSWVPERNPWGGPAQARSAPGEMAQGGIRERRDKERGTAEGRFLPARPAQELPHKPAPRCHRDFSHPAEDSRSEGVPRAQHVLLQGL